MKFPVLVIIFILGINNLLAQDTITINQTKISYGLDYFDNQLYFEYGSSILTEESKNKLDCYKANINFNFNDIEKPIRICFGGWKGNWVSQEELEMFLSGANNIIYYLFNEKVGNFILDIRFCGPANSLYDKNNNQIWTAEVQLPILINNELYNFDFSKGCNF